MTMENIIEKIPPFFGGETSLVPIDDNKVYAVFAPLGAQDAEMDEIKDELVCAINSLDKPYIRQNPDVADELLSKIEELSDTRSRFHAPYELILEAIQDDPMAVKHLVEMGKHDSPKEILDKLLNVGYSFSDYRDDIDEEEGENS